MLLLDVDYLLRVFSQPGIKDPPLLLLRACHGRHSPLPALPDLPACSFLPQDLGTDSSRELSSLHVTHSRQLSLNFTTP